MRNDPALAERADVAGIIGAAGPHPAYRDELMLFGQFVGSWDVDATQHAPDGKSQRMRGEWHFFWTLEGRAIQDVILTPPRGERDPNRWDMGDYQIAVRFYRPTTGTWDVTAISPVFGQVHRLVARKAGEAIVLEGTRPDGRPQRWSFYDIAPERCRWRGEVSSDGGATWFVDEEMTLLRRTARPPASGL